MIRYDHRDTGRSVTYQPGHPRYTGSDLVADAVGVLDAYGLVAAHVVGVSAGGAFAQLLALGVPDRVLSLVLISTSPATGGERNLPAATEGFGGFLASAEVDWSSRGSVIEYLVAYERMLTGGVRPFDESAWREFVGRDVERARDIAASQNHTMIPDGGVPSEPISAIEVPTLAIHGTADPHVPARARADARRGDPRRPAADTGRSRSRHCSGRLGDHRRSDPRAHRDTRRRSKRC